MQTHPLEFNDADSNELEAISDSLATGLGLQPSVIPEGWHILVVRNGRKEAYMVSPTVYSYFTEVKATRMPYSLGLFLGVLKKPGRTLDVSLEFVAWLGHRGILRRTATVSDTGEQHVLYGRHLTKSMVSIFPDGLREGETLPLVNRHGEVLALGKALCGYEAALTAEPSRHVIKTLQDKGWYLRRGG